MDDAKKQLNFEAPHTEEVESTGKKRLLDNVPAPEPKRKRHAPLYQYKKKVTKIAVVPATNLTKAETSTGAGTSGAGTSNAPTRQPPPLPPLPPLPQPPKYRSRLGVFDIDLTYPSFRMRRDAQRPGSGTQHHNPEPGPSTPRLEGSDEDRAYNHFYQRVEETVISSSPEWITSSEDEERP